MSRCPGSFRDPSGCVFDDGARILRTVSDSYQPHWEQASSSGLLQVLVEEKKVPSFREGNPLLSAWKTIEVERLPFISFPYEWCFSQLKDAALLTLGCHQRALAHDMVLKDASAYNVQFRGTDPVFIDLLSFEKWHRGQPWQAYRHFCMHFLAPLALTAYGDLRASRLSQLWVDGIPLDLASALLPLRSYLSWGTLWHIHAHARMLQKYSDGRVIAEKARAVHMEKVTLCQMASALERSVSAIKLPEKKTQWGDYYEDTNYTDAATQEKIRLVSLVAERMRGKLAVDLGANTGRYSRLLAPHFDDVLAPDIDSLAVERHYLDLKQTPIRNIFPMVLDLANPSPSIGWACHERLSFQDRCKAGLVLSLALIHHLVIAAGIPFDEIAAHFAELLAPGGHLLMEFVPKEDSQVRRLLAAREDIFTDYAVERFEKVFSQYFKEIERFPIAGTVRTLYLFQKNEEV